jgi:hypothetical protein
MEIIVTAFAALVAAGCFIAILKSDLTDSEKSQPKAANPEKQTD